MFQSLPCKSLSSAITYNRRHIGPKCHYKQGKCQHFFRKRLDATRFESLTVRETTTFTSTLCPSVVCLCGHLPLSHNPRFPKSHVRTEVSRELDGRFRPRHERDLERSNSHQFFLYLLYGNKYCIFKKNRFVKSINHVARLYNVYNASPNKLHMKDMTTILA